MSDTAALPPTLRAYLEAGCDLTVIPDLDLFARAIVISNHTATSDDRRMMGDFYAQNLAQWAEGRPVTVDGETFEPSFERIRHAMWLSEGFTDPLVADMFERAIPADLRELCLARVAEVEGERGPGEG